MLRISKTELAQRLEERVECAQGGVAGLNILIHGWFNFKKYGKKYREAVYHRKWLYIIEVQELSEYAGVDLTKNEL